MQRTQKQIERDNSQSSYRAGMLVEKVTGVEKRYLSDLPVGTVGVVEGHEHPYVMVNFFNRAEPWVMIPGTEIRHYIPGNRVSARIAELVETTPLSELYSAAESYVFPFPRRISCLWGNGTAEEEKLECEIKLILFTLLQLVDDETFDALAAEAAN